MGILGISGSVAGISGLAVGALILVFRDVLKKNIFPALTKKQAYVIIMTIVVLVWIVAMVGILSHYFASEFKLNPEPFAKESVNPNSKDVFGVEIKSIHWEHDYFENGDFTGEVRYKVNNVSNFNIVELPPERAGWRGWNIDYDKRFVIHGDQAEFQNLTGSHFFPDTFMTAHLEGINEPVTYYYWYPRVKPGIRPGGSLDYSVIIDTKGSETEIFSPNGDHAGMGTLYETHRITSRINAPDGYYFEIRGIVAKDKDGIEIEFDREKYPPVMSPDSSFITWEIDDPVPAANYLVKISALRKQ